MRIKLKLPDNQIFTTKTIVRIDDINYGNHLSNDKILVYAQQARVEWLASLNFTEIRLGKDDLGIIMADAAIMYQSEGHLGDILSLELYVGNITRIGFDLYCQITNTKTNRSVARVKTGILIFDYKERKITSIPDNLAPFLA